MKENNMNCFFWTDGAVQSLIDEIIEELFWQVAKIHIQKAEFSKVPAENLCTIYTAFSGGYKTKFFFCAEPALMKRIAQNMAEEPITDWDEIVEYVKEFVNVICGHIVASIFYKTERSARFHCPEMMDGYHVPADARDNKIVKTQYTDAELENMMLLYDNITPIAG